MMRTDCAVPKESIFRHAPGFMCKAVVRLAHTPWNVRETSSYHWSLMIVNSEY